MIGSRGVNYGTNKWIKSAVLSPIEEFDDLTSIGNNVIFTTIL